MRSKFHWIPVYILGGLVVFAFSVLTQAKDAPKETVAANGKTEVQAPGSKTFTEAEFKAALEKEVEKNLKRMGQESLIEFSKELMKKEDEIQAKEFDLKKKNEELDMIKKEFQKQLVEFTDKQKNFLACIDTVDNKENQRIDHMVQIVSGMRPSNAAEVLSVQDAQISVQILGKLEPQKVSKIFNLMDKEISARLQKQYMTMKK